MEPTRARLLARFGARVEPWWEQLPQTLEALAARWELAIGEPVGRGNTSLVLRCRRSDGRAAMLKLSPDPDLAAAESRALSSWEATRRVPALWGYDPDTGALLLEAIPSESPLAAAGVDDIAALMRALHATGVPRGVPPLADRVEFVFGLWAERAGELRAQLAAGHEEARSLAAGVGTPVLLHGDLHPGNVLDAGPPRGLVAIDPRPCAGDAAFDAVDWVFWNAEPDAWAGRCLELAAALVYDPARLWRWCAAFAPMLAVSRVRKGARAGEVAALLAVLSDRRTRLG